MTPILEYSTEILTTAEEYGCLLPRLSAFSMRSVVLLGRDTVVNSQYLCWMKKANIP